jgi:peptidyl-prolyl cis-trans isomerase-like 3
MSLTLHTDLGNIKIELYCDAAPKGCKNFLALCASGYYDGCIFHRNIKGFIVQTGDPTNTGKNGKSIWGEFFDDELKGNELALFSIDFIYLIKNQPIKY